MTPELKVAATVSSEAEAELVQARLREAGIEAVAQRTIGGPEWGYSGSRYVYVPEADLERATALLSEQPVSDEELTRLAEEAGQAGDADGP